MTYLFEDISSLEEFLAVNYGLKGVNQVQKNRAVLKVSMQAGEYALKNTPYSLKKLAFLQEVMQFLRDRGFDDFPRSIYNLAGKMFTSYKGQTYSLMEWLPGEESNFLDHQDLEKCARTLGKLHRITAGFNYSGRNWSDTWLKGYNRIVELDMSYVPGLKELKPEILTTALRTLNLLGNSKVQRSLIGPKVVCHHDLSHRNFILTPEGQTYLIDFDYAVADVAMRDVAHFLARVLKRHNWDTKVGTLLLSNYLKENPLSEGDLGAIWAFLYFPRSLWSLPDRLKDEQPDKIMAKIGKSLQRIEALRQLEDSFPELRDLML